MTIIFQQGTSVFHVAVNSVQIHPHISDETVLGTGPAHLLRCIIQDDSDFYILPPTLFDGTPFALFEKIDIEPIKWEDTISVKEFMDLIQQS